MTFNPAIPFSSVSGYQFLQRTQERQLEAFSRSPQIQRDIAYFRENIGNVTSPQDLVGDTRLLRVSLTAFGLSEATNQQALVRRVLEEGTSDPTAFANRLGDRRYARLADAFQFDRPGGSNLTRPSFQEDVIARFQVLSFEAAVGEVDVDQRLALNFKREATEIASRDLPPRTLWLQLLGTSALRQVLELGFNLPTGFVQLDIDRQVDILSDGALSRFGTTSPAVFSDPEVIDSFLSRFFVRRDLNLNSPARGTTALTLLQASQSAGGFANLVRSNF